NIYIECYFFFQAEDGIRDRNVTGVQTCALPIFSADNDQFLSDKANVREIVKQVYQFSRIYWKSITQQNLPVTIKYPELVAQMFRSEERRVGKEGRWWLWREQEEERKRAR